ncbi:MAG TPA: elongation factor G [Candidatus Kapabacteria bacterium]|jgi:elongation factor G|nr:elongation factor G [Candidatus Kapabacteria bacterium]HOV91839.1 elongation factor G [Candidatus Kapabacteria bacterium]
MDLSKVRNIGIAAHIDSGKTTLSERILYYTGRIHQIVEVRSKTGDGPTMDSMDLEREKGITIQSAATYCKWKDYKINLIDTPGHIDFTVEVERALRVLDGAILVLCGVAGVQSQSITVDRQMRRYNVPRIAFINKVDRAGANPDRVINQLEEKLNHKPVMITMPIGLEDNFKGIVDLIKMKAIYYEGDNGENVIEQEIPNYLLAEAQKRRQKMIERIADYDDNIANKYLGDEKIFNDELIAAIRKATIAMHITPVYVGTAKQNKGVQTLLDGVGLFLPAPNEVKNYAVDLDDNENQVELIPDKSLPTIALAFKLEDGKYGQLTYMRIYQGSIKKGDTLVNIHTGRKLKVPRIVKMHAAQMEDIDEADAGDIIGMFGVDCSSGDTFTDGRLNYSLTSMHIPTPVIELAIAPKERTLEANFSKALNRFQKEDPTFIVYRDEESGETIMKGMGELHLEIYIERIRREYNTEVVVGKPKVAYRETITQRADFDYTHKKQTGGAGQFARVAGYIEPLKEPNDEHYLFENKVIGGVIPKEYIPACDKGFREQLHEGFIIRQPIVNVKVVLNDGSTHPVDSSELAFKLASRSAIREILPKAKPIILEPIMKLEVAIPEEFQGVVIGNLNQRRGIIHNTTLDAKYITIEAEVPLREMFGYSSDLRSLTQGKGEFTMEFMKYQPVPKSIEEEILKEYKEKEQKK